MNDIEIEQNQIIKVSLSDNLRIEIIRMGEDIEHFLSKYPHLSAS